MTNPSFNLLDEPWIQAVEHNGTVAEVSLLEVFTRPRDFSRLTGDLVTQEAAIFRLLLAIMHRAVRGPEDIDHWEELYRDEETTLRTVRDYLERFRSRFDLRHPSEPFLQVANLRTTSGTTAPLNSLIQDVPTNHAFLTTRRGRGLDGISWAEAARWLLAIHAFDISGIHSGAVGDPRVKNGKGYGIGVGWAGELGLITVRGDCLWNTLMFNLVAAGEVAALSEWNFDEDLPPWELPQQTEKTADPAGLDPRGPVQCYTWQSRRILLFGEDDVTSALICQGDKITAGNRQTVEPQTAWRYSKPQSKTTDVYMPQKFFDEVLAWRGMRAIIARLVDPMKMRSGEMGPGQLPSATIEWFGTLLEELPELVGDGRHYPVELLSVNYGTQAAVIDEIVTDSFVLPRSLLKKNPEIVAAVKSSILLAEQVGSELWGFGRNLSSAAGARSDSDNAKSNGDRLRQEFYLVMERHFRRWAQDLATPTGPAIARWQHLLNAEARRVSQMAVARVPVTAHRGGSRGFAGSNIDVGKAVRIFNAGLRRLLPEVYPPREDNKK